MYALTALLVLLATVSPVSSSLESEPNQTCRDLYRSYLQQNEGRTAFLREWKASANKNPLTPVEEMERQRQLHEWDRREEAASIQFEFLCVRGGWVVE